MTIINARNLVGAGFPHEEGKKLAEYIVSSLSAKKEFKIDLSDCQPKLLISAFFNTFLQTIYDNDPKLLDSARQIVWILKHDFQRENVARWMTDFKPESKMSDKTADVKAENDTDCNEVMDQVNRALTPHGLTFEYDEDKYWEDMCACAWQLKPTVSALSVAGKMADFLTAELMKKRHDETLEEVDKFLKISMLVSAYQNRIVEFGIFPVQISYPNGTMMACHSVEMQFQMQPPLSEGEIKDFTDLGFRVFKSEIMEDATAAVREMNWV